MSLAGDPVERDERQARDMTLSGRVEELSVGEILGQLLCSRETAIVTAEREGISKAVHVEAGRVIFARSRDRDDRLGEVLLREGMISAEQYDESGRLIRQGKRQGTILVELGYITPAELVKGVKLQVEHVVRDLLSWRQGSYSIEMGELDTRDIITVNISTENLLFDGIKRGAGWSQIMRGLGGTLDSVPNRLPDSETRLYKLDLSEDEAHVVTLVNGRLSAAQICSMSYLSNHDTCVVLHGLACCGIVEAGRASDPETLFREQLVEAEMAEIADLVAAFNERLQSAESSLVAVFGEARDAALARAAESLADEHWDVLRSARLDRAGLDARIIMENVADIESGSRKTAVERALVAARAAMEEQARRSGGETAASRVAQVLVADTKELR